jgi:hypothetical protein
MSGERTVSEGAGPPILHIGYHKTGSSWLQRSFFPRARGISLVERLAVRREILVPSLVAFDPERARARLLEGRSGRLVISEEELSGNLHTGGLHGAFSVELASRLHRCFPEGRVLVFIRNQTTMITSAYKQYIKSGGTHGIRRFLQPARSPHKTPNFSLDFLVYDRLIGIYESLFGRANVLVHAYEELRARPQQLIRTLAGELALEVDPAAVSVSAVNAGYRSGTLALLRLLNHFHDREMPNSTCLLNVPGMHGLLDALAPRVDRLPFMGQVQELDDLLRPDEIRALEDRYRESNERLEKSRGLGLHEHGYPLP